MAVSISAPNEPRFASDSVMLVNPETSATSTAPVNFSAKGSARGRGSRANRRKTTFGT